MGLRVVVAGLVALVVGTTGALRAEDAPRNGTPAPTIAATAAIPASDVSISAARTLAEIRDLTARLPASSASAEVDTALARIEADMREPGDERLLVTSGTTLSDLEVVQRRLARVSDDLNHLAELSTQQSRAIDVAMGRLREMDETWKRTAEAREHDELPAVVMKDIVSTRAAIAQGLTQLVAERDRRLALAASVGALQVQMVERRARVGEVVARLRREVLRAESAPLWTALAGRDPGSSLGAGLSHAWTTRVAELRTFLELHPDTLAGRALGFAILLVAMIIVRRRTREWVTADPTLVAIKALSGHPLASALLLGALLSLLAGADDPAALIEISRLLVVLPAYFLLRGTFTGRLATLPAALSIAATADGLRRILPPLSPESRILLFAEALGVGLWGLWVLRTSAIAELPISPRSRRIVLRGGQIGTAILGLALVTNISGNATLAVSLTRGVFATTVLAIALRTAVAILDGVVIAFLEQGPLRSRPSISNHRPAIRRRCLRLLHLLGFAVWIVGTLDAFGIGSIAFARLQSLFAARLETGSLSISLRDVLALAVTLWVALVAARIMRVVLEEEILAAMVLPRGVPGAISAAVNYVILVVGFLIAISAAGLDLGRVTLLAGAFSVGIGFGLQNVINNFVSGLILLFERPVRVGDVVEIGGMTGTVSHMGIRSSRVRTFDGSDVIIPNGALIQERLTNWTLSDFRRRIEITIGVAYGSEPASVIGLLEGAAATIDEILRDPPPLALFVGFGESSLDFVLRAWTLYYENLPVIRSRLALAVHDTLRGAGVEIPFPQRDLHIRSS